MRMHEQFIRQLQQLLYSISEVGGMITEEEAHAITEEVHQTLFPGKSNHGDEPTPKATMAALHLDALHALKRFMNFITSHEKAMDSRMIDAFRIVADHLSDYYAVTSKREKDLLLEMKQKAGLMQGDRRKAG